MRPGDRVLVSGPIGDHGMAVMVARGELQLEVDLESDTACVLELAQALLTLGGDVRFMRDPTRGGVATTLNELAQASGTAVHLDEAALPVRPEVVGTSEILGIDPLYVACEGRLIAVVSAEACERGARAAPVAAARRRGGDHRRRARRARRPRAARDGLRRQPGRRHARGRSPPPHLLTRR